MTPALILVGAAGFAAGALLTGARIGAGALLLFTGLGALALAATLATML